uniref:Uncharacterized protein n=1 Tax=Zea mays TaxID=4577 RepID=B6UC37_MAIZE|nr:hypothetical protein [Zea mays]|eukprot:NP_001145346.1 uncharacterized LOC100278675 precursor [Zea mays]
MAWWRARVVASVRRAWLAVAVAAARARVRKGECGGVLSLHRDVQTCGYQDVQVMWNMLSSDKEAAAGALPKPPRRKRPSSVWRLPLCPVRSPRAAPG